MLYIPRILAGITILSFGLQTVGLAEPVAAAQISDQMPQVNTAAADQNEAAVTHYNAVLELTGPVLPLESSGSGEEVRDDAGRLIERTVRNEAGEVVTHEVWQYDPLTGKKTQYEFSDLTPNPDFGYQVVTYDANELVATDKRFSDSQSGTLLYEAFYTNGQIFQDFTHFEDYVAYRLYQQMPNNGPRVVTLSAYFSDGRFDLEVFGYTSSGMMTGSTRFDLQTGLKTMEKVYDGSGSLLEKREYESGRLVRLLKYGQGPLSTDPEDSDRLGGDSRKYANSVQSFDGVTGDSVSEVDLFYDFDSFGNGKIVRKYHRDPVNGSVFKTEFFEYEVKGDRLLSSITYEDGGNKREEHYFKYVENGHYEIIEYYVAGRLLSRTINAHVDNSREERFFDSFEDERYEYTNYYVNDVLVLTNIDVYDPQNRFMGWIISDANSLNTYSLDSVGRKWKIRVTSADPLEHYDLTFVYDAQGRLAQTVRENFGGGERTVRDYDVLGRLLKTVTSNPWLKTSETHYYDPETGEEIFP